MSSVRVSKTTPEQEVKDFVEMSLQSVRDNDAEAMEEIFSNDYDLIVSTGTLMTKQQLVDVYRNGDMKQKTLKVQNLEARVYEETAIARGLYQSGFEYKGQQMKHDFVRTDVLVKTSGKWQFVTSQTTELAPEQGEP